MTTRVFNPRTQNSGNLVRLAHGEPVVQWFGDHIEYPTTWRQLVVVTSDEYVLPAGKFETELWVDALGDCWRRRVIESAWPCETGKRHVVDPQTCLCGNCGAEADLVELVEIFVQVSAEGHATGQLNDPSSREDVESAAGVLLLVGSPEARSRAHAVSSTPTPGGGCPMALLVYGVALLALAMIGLQLYRWVS